MTTFKAKTAAAFPIHNPDGTCDNVSCHGGNTTPIWGQGPANGLTCTQCHSAGTEYQVPEFNSYYSGFFAGPNGNVNLHNFHLDPSPFPVGSGISITCTNCHDTARLTKEQHFGGLAARTFVFPGNTVSGPNTRIGSYDPINKICSGVSCHTRVPASSIRWNIFPD
jgi:predicted CxxxxCH...CXXCH cytochrome family protein